MEKREKIAKTKLEIDRVKQILIVASGKGGVGKSTISVAIAEQLTSQGAKVGIIDADIYGPSIPTILGLSGKPELSGNKMVPLISRGIKVISMGFLVSADSAIAWRGPMSTKAMYQLFCCTNWGDLDHLIVDTPPGTGDIHLSLLENYNIDGTIIVTTPQKIAVADVIKAIDLYKKFSVPIWGIVENMSDAFSGTGGTDLAKKYNIPLIAQIPLNKEISERTDKAIEIGSIMPRLLL
ncbi:MAG: Mrp/NBP35 family ATP-binding protein [Rickettsiaceae bacterium]|nr:Mrp/NBP35 family ATP-binding protein [Rickettsiaceae bacterium]